MKINLKRLFKVETLQNQVYYFDSIDIDEAIKYVNQHKSSHISDCYAEEQKQDNFTYYYLAKPEVKLDIDKLNKGKDYSGYDIDGNLLAKAKKLKEEAGEFFSVSGGPREIYREGSMGDYLERTVMDKITENDYKDSLKVLFLTKNNAELYEIDRRKKIFLGVHAQDLVKSLEARKTLGLYKTQRETLCKEIDATIAKRQKLEDDIRTLEEQYEKGMRLTK